MNNKKAVNQLSTMVLVTIISQVFILLKNSLVAANFGVSIDIDAFYFSANISNFLYSFIGAGISTILIPYLREKKNKQSINVFISVIYTFGFFILIFMFIFREQIILILSGTNNNEFLRIASSIFIFTLITGFMNSLIGLVRGVLEYKGQFNRQRLTVLFANLLLLIMLLLDNSFNIYYYAAIVLIATLTNLTIHLFFIQKSGFKYNIDFSINNNGFKEMMKLFLPVILSTGLYQLSLLIDTGIAARLGVGSISILNYANAIIFMINMLLLGNLTSYFYPRLVKKETEVSRQKSLVEYILFLNVILCFIVTLFTVVGEDAIRILYERGNFNDENTKIVFICALIYIIALPTNGIRDLIYKYFYINKDTSTPFINSMVISIVNLIISIIFSIYFGLYGVVLGTVVSSYLSLFLIVLKFKNKFPINFDIKFIVIEILKVILVTTAAILILVSAKYYIGIESILLNLLINFVLTLIVFSSLLFFTRSKVFNITL